MSKTNKKVEPKNLWIRELQLFAHRGYKCQYLHLLFVAEKFRIDTRLGVIV